MDKIEHPCRKCDHEFDDKNNEPACQNCIKKEEHMIKTGMMKKIESSSDNAEKRKICKSPDCKFGGVAQPFSNFHIDNSTKDGRNRFCKVCRNQYKDAMRTSYKEKNTGIKAVKKKEQPKGYSLYIDFTDNPNIYEALVKESKQQFRTLDLQVLSILNGTYLQQEKQGGLKNDRRK